MSNIEKYKNIHDLEKNLSESELQRYNKFINSKRKLQYLVSHVIVKSVCGENIITDKSGVPTIKSGFVSIAHKDNYVVVAISDMRVGIDIENAEIERDFAKQSELMGLTITDNKKDFYQNFVTFEAKFKYGKDADKANIYLYKTGKYLIGVCSKENVKNIEFISSGTK
jgi:hypothetical protein